LKAVLLAAGLGTRLQPLTNSIPKCLVNIHGKPLLQYWLELLFSGDIHQVLINTHYLPDAVYEFVNHGQWRDRICLVHENELLGTGGTLLSNREWLSEGPFLVAHADNLTDFNLAQFVDRHENRPTRIEITMMTFITDSPESCGIIDTDEEGIVWGFHEKSSNPPGNCANAAVYIFEPEIFGFLAKLGKKQIDLSTEVIPHYLGKIVTFHNPHYHRDIGTPESLAMAEIEFRAETRK